MQWNTRLTSPRSTRRWIEYDHRMPRGTFDDPPAMRHLPEVIREKASEIANALLEEGYDEGRAIRIAIAKAKEWAVRRGS